MIKGGKKNIERKLWNNMGSENKKLIIPYRYMPFDIGTSIQELITEPKFSELPDLYMIYLTLRDFIGSHKTVYHVERQIAETQSHLNNGYHEIYINAEVDDKSSITEIMKVLSTTDYVNNNFKTITGMKEEKIMPVEVERAIEGLREEGEIKAYVNLLREGLISEEVVLNKLNISKEELKK